MKTPVTTCGHDPLKYYIGCNGCATELIIKLKEQVDFLAVLALQHGIISRGKFSELTNVDRCDIDEYVENYNQEQ
jgi:hypothetical protein